MGDEGNSEGSVDGPFRCRVCGREFADEAALERHVRDKGLLW